VKPAVCHSDAREDQFDVGLAICNIQNWIHTLTENMFSPLLVDVHSGILSSKNKT